MHRLSLFALACLALSACDQSGPTFETPPRPSAQRVPFSDLSTDGRAMADGLVSNPSGRVPLGALLTLQTARPTSVQLEVLGAEPVSHAPDAVRTEHRLPILGLYPAAENRVVVRVDAQEQNQYSLDTLVIETPPLPPGFPAIDVAPRDAARAEPGWTLSHLSIGDDGTFKSYPLLFDHEGQTRWYLDLSDYGDTVFFVRRLQNGNYLVPFRRALREVDVLGQEVRTWSIPGYVYHHEVIELPTGNLVVAVNKDETGTVEDHIVEVDRATSAILREWDMRALLDTDRFDLVADPVDWFHMNAIQYDESSDALIVSGRNQGVVKVTMQNELVWILAPHRGWGVGGDGADTRERLLTAVDAAGTPYPQAVQEGERAAADFDWTWGQHAPLVLSNGNLLVFDNGFVRHWGTGDAYSRAVEYEIDESAMTVRQVWSYGRSRGEAYFSRIISDVDELPETGNLLVAPGVVNFGGESYTYITEVSRASGAVVSEAKLTFANANNTGQGWGQLDISYRAERLPLYPPGYDGIADGETTEEVPGGGAPVVPLQPPSL